MEPFIYQASKPFATFETVNFYQLSFTAYLVRLAPIIGFRDA